MPRRYQLKQRALRQEETRRRIVEAAVALHQEIGPARTSISSIAERAGVQRHTVYRYFPDETTLFQACSGHFRSLHPPPDPKGFLAIADPAERLQAGLSATYAYFRENQQMIANVLRDAEVVPVGQGFLVHRAAMADVLARGFDHLGQHPQLRAAIGLAVTFWTWRTLVRDEGLSDEQAVELMTQTVLCTAARLRAGITDAP